MSCAARSLFFFCRQLKPAALHLRVDARQALGASIHLGAGLAVQPALNEGLCVDKGAWRVQSGACTWQLGLNQSTRDQDQPSLLPFSLIHQLPSFDSALKGRRMD